MLLLLSPSKTQEFGAPKRTIAPTQPQLTKQCLQLVERLRNLSAEELAELMDISPKLAELNYGRYQNFKKTFTPKNATPAALAFKGDVYDGLAADSFSTEDLAFAQQHLRILSGLYGVLRPLDLIQPYRLEMGTALSMPESRNLYEFWGDTITRTLNAEKKTPLINLASAEYFKAVKPEKFKGPIITIHFKERRNGKLQVIGLLAKKARGTMAHYVIKKHIHSPEQLTLFRQDGYAFEKTLSDKRNWVFAR